MISKKDHDLDVHIKVFNYAIKTNAQTSEEYIINVFSYTLRNMTLDWHHNYMSKNFDCIFQSLHMHFANIIERFKMMSEYTWSRRT